MIHSGAIINIGGSYMRVAWANEESFRAHSVWHESSTSQLYPQSAAENRVVRNLAELQQDVLYYGTRISFETGQIKRCRKPEAIQENQDLLEALKAGLADTEQAIKILLENAAEEERANEETDRLVSEFEARIAAEEEMLSERLDADEERAALATDFDYRS